MEKELIPIVFAAVTWGGAKCDQFRMGSDIVADSPLYPVSALLHYIAARGDRPGPYFLNTAKGVITKPWFVRHPTQHQPTPTPVCWSQLSHRGGDHSSIGGGRGFNDPDAGSLAQRCLPPVHKDTEGTPGGHCRSHGPLPLSSGRPGWGRMARALRR